MLELLNIMKELREKCPWDQAQTPESLTRYAIEEAYEVEAAVRSGDHNHVKEELGDLLLQVVFQAQMYSEQGAFNFDDVVEAICQKLIRRHPHVFDQDNFKDLSPDQVSVLWQDIKQKEKQGKPKSRLDEVKHAPALVQAENIQKNVAKIGFDFENIEDAMAKVNEELKEFNEAILHNNSDEMQDELGDCLFSLINVGRKLGVSGEMALLGTIHKFKMRFAYIEDRVLEQKKHLQDMSLQELDALWDQAKIYLKQQSLKKNNFTQVQYE